MTVPGRRTGRQACTQPTNISMNNPLWTDKTASGRSAAGAKPGDGHAAHVVLAAAGDQHQQAERGERNGEVHAAGSASTSRRCMMS
jgi:hypothetical protein